MRNTLMFAAAVAAAGIGLAAPSVQASTNSASRAGKNECVFTRSIYDFKALDRNNLVIWAPSRSKAYLVELSMPLPSSQPMSATIRPSSPSTMTSGSLKMTDECHE